jgi:hypothetical protein
MVTQTNADGVFSINVNEGDVLQFTYTGFAPAQVTVGSANDISLSMKVEASRLDEVVVVGYGTQKRKEVTGAVSSVNARALNTHLLQTLQQLYRVIRPVFVYNNEPDNRVQHLPLPLEVVWILMVMERPYLLLTALLFLHYMVLM